MATLKDIAKKTGFSISTISYALNDDYRIPSETKKIITKAADELGYKIKKSLTTNNSANKFIVLALSTMDGYIFSTLYNAIKVILKLTNSTLLVSLSTNLSQFVWADGFIILNPNITDSEIRSLVSRKIPLVVMDRELQIDGVSSVCVDNYNSMRVLTRKVLNRGAKSFIFIAGPENSIESNLRFQGFKSILDENKIIFNDSNFFRASFTRSSARLVCEAAKLSNKLPDCIVCANDEMAMGVIDYFIKYDIDYSKILITGFDGVNEINILNFITCKVDHSHWGSVAAYVMNQMLNKIQNEHFNITTEIIEH